MKTFRYAGLMGWLLSAACSDATGGTTSTGGTTGTGDCAGKGLSTTSYSYTDNVPPSQLPPGGMAVSNTPMFVSIGWDDNGYSGLDGNEGGVKWVSDVMAERQNGDGSNIRTTFFHTTAYISSRHFESQTYVKRAWNQVMLAGSEVGLHSQTHPHGSSYSGAQWASEMDSTIAWLIKPFKNAEPIHSPDSTKGIGADRNKLYGWRTPYLEYSAAMFAELKNRGVWYDASISEGFQPGIDGSNNYWPYTLNSGSPGHTWMRNAGSPMKQFALPAQPGLWEMPLYVLIAPPDSASAEYGIPTGFRSRLKSKVSYFDETTGKILGLDYNLWMIYGMSKAEVLATLKYTFDRHFQGNRAPFMLGAHSDIYATRAPTLPSATKLEAQQAIEEFLDYVLTKPETRVVTIKEILNWVRDPIPARCL